MRPDSIPIRPLASHATLSSSDAHQLFGTESLKGREQVQVLRLGTEVGRVAVRVGEETHVVADSLLAITGHVRLSGPLSAVSAPVSRVRSRLLAPSALRRAWGLADSASVVFGPVAVAVPVVEGDLALEIDRALWLGAGQPETARWVAGLALPPPQRDEADDRPREILRRVITETDVRQAILHRTQLRLRPGQIVTPAAQSLAREHGVFAL
ncbi:MAG: hypothetical protein AAGI52_11090 [Bacteroidota bacterium]